MAETAAAATMCEAFQATVARYPRQVALRALGGAATMTWEQYAGRMCQIAAGLAGLGVRRGDTVALMMTNRPEFHLVDTAAFHLGAVPFSVYNTFAPGQAEAPSAPALPRTLGSPSRQQPQGAFAFARPVGQGRVRSWRHSMPDPAQRRPPRDAALIWFSWFGTL